MKKLINIIKNLSIVVLLMHVFNKLVKYGNKRGNNNNSDQKYDWKYGKINYSVSGNSSSKPILLIHNTSYDSSKEEVKILDNILNIKYNIYSIDLLGYGNSDKTTLTYTAYLYTKLINDFIENVIGRPTTILTLGKSAIYSYSASIWNHKLTHNIININPPSILSTELEMSNTGIILKKLIELPVIGTFLYNLINNKTFYKIIHNKNMNKVNNSIYDENSKFTFTSNYFNYNSSNLENLLKKTKTKCSLIAPNNSKYHKICDEYQEINPTINCYYIKNSNAELPIEKSSKVAKIVDIVSK